MKHLLKTKIIYLLILLIADGAYFSLLDPERVPSVFLIAGFILLVVTFYLVVTLLVEIFSTTENGPSNRSKNTVLILTILVAFLIAMQSIGQLGLRDVLVTVPLAVLFFIYLSYSTKKN